MAQKQEVQVQIVQLSVEELKQIIQSACQEVVQLTAAQRNPQDLITRQELAEWLKIDLSTIHNWKKRGKITAYSIGNRVYFKRAEIEAAMQPLKG